jgi:hypothetical protein
MIDYKDLLNMLHRLEKKKIIDEIKLPDINATFTKDMYKNGNVKAYESIIKLAHPRNRIEIRNKDFDKYEELVHKTIDHFLLIHAVNYYEKQIKKYYLIMSRVHNKDLIERDFNGLYKRDLDDINKESIMPEKLYLARLLKPTIYDSKYEIRESINSRKKYKELSKMKQKIFEDDLTAFNEKVAQQSIKKREYYIKEYKDLSDSSKMNEKITSLEQKYSSLKEGYLNMKKETLVAKYFKHVLKNNIIIHESYKNLKHSFFLDIDSKAIVLNLQIPIYDDYPKIESLNIIKKSLTCREKYIDEKPLNIALCSYILSFIKLFYEIDDTRLFESLYINIYKGTKGEKLPNMKCYSLIKVDLNKYSELRKKKFDSCEFLELLVGKSISYDDLNQEVLPLQKGGI